MMNFTPRLIHSNAIEFYFISYTDVILYIHVDENIHRNATQKSLILTMLGLEITIISNNSTTA